MKKMQNGKGIVSRILSILLVSVMLLSVVVGCGNTDKQTATSTEVSTNSSDTTASAKPDSWISDEPIEFSMLYSDNAAFPFNEDWLILKEMTKRTNVTLKVNAVPESDFREKTKLLLSSGDVPDFIAVADQIDQAFALNGILLPISDYMDKLPYFSKAIEAGKVQGEIDNITQVDGKFYYMPGIRVAMPAYSGLAFRTDLLKKYGMETPKNVDELYQYLKKYKTENPKSAPLTVQLGFDCFMYFFGPVWGLQAGWSADNGMFYDWQTNKFDYTYTNERYKEMLKYIAKLYAEGLLDPEAFTQNDDQWRTKLSTGVSVASYMWNGGDRQLNPIGQKTFPDFSLEMSSPLSALPGITGTTEAYPQLKHGWAMPATAAKNPNFDKMLKFMDWMISSEEATILGNWGVEGVTFKYNDKKEKEWIVDNIDTQKDYGLCNNSLQPSTPEDYELSISLPYMANVTKFNKENNLFGKVPPKAKFSVDEIEEAKLIASPLKDYCEKMQQQFIFGKKSIDKDWDAFVKEVQSKDVQKLVDMYNAKLSK